MKKFKSTIVLAFIFSFLTAFTAFAGEGNSLIINDTHDGSSNRPYEFKDSLSWGYADDYVNNGFYLPANNGALKHISFKAPANGGYVAVTFPDDYSQSLYVYKGGGGGTAYLEGKEMYFEPNETIKIGIYADKINSFINLRLHEHGKKYDTYESNGEKCKHISYCGCGYKNIASAYSYELIDHEYGDATTKPATCTEPGYSEKTCKKCGYVSKETTEQKLGHSYTGAVSPDDSTYHKVSCIRCDSTELKSHTYISNGNTKTCTICNLTVDASAGGGSVLSIIPGTIRVTKLSSSKAGVTVSVPTRASSTDVYMNGKKVKTLTSSGSFTLNKSGAGKAKYKVISHFTIDGKVQDSNYSAETKPMKNEIVYTGAGSLNPRNVGRYGTCTHRSSKLKYSGKTLKCTAYIYNNRMFKLKKIKIHATVTINGKTRTKTITKSCNVSAYGKKKITYTLGKGITDLHGDNFRFSVYTDGNWGYGWNQ